MTSLFLLLLLKFFLCFLTFDYLIIMCLSVILFGFNLFGALLGLMDVKRPFLSLHLGSFQPLLLQIHFPPLPLSLLLLEFP